MRICNPPAALLDAGEGRAGGLITLEQLWPECGVLLLKAAGLGAVFAIDAQSAIGVAGARPLVVGIVAGWALGETGIGLTVGAYLQLIWMRSPARGRGPGPDPGSGTVAAVVAAVAFAPFVPHGYGHLALAVVVAIVTAELGVWTESLRRAANRRLAEAALRGLRKGRSRALGAAQALGVAGAASRGAATAVSGAAVGLLAGSVGINLLGGMDFGAAFALIPCVGLGSVFPSAFRAGRVGVACLAAGTAVALLIGLELGLP